VTPSGAVKALAAGTPPEHPVPWTISRRLAKDWPAPKVRDVGFAVLNLELLTGFEPMTSSLPRKCSTS
jgi:hypothetical protein